MNIYIAINRIGPNFVSKEAIDDEIYMNILPQFNHLNKSSSKIKVKVKIKFNNH